MAQVYSDLIAAGGDRKERYVPKIFGFKIHEVCVEQKKQDAVRDEQKERLAMIED
jgi:hypothetical protein